MLDEVVDRFKTLDSKAAGIAAYAIALITFLVASKAQWATAPHSWAVYAPIVSGCIALSAAAVAISTLWLKRFPGFSENEWVKADCLDDIEKLRRYHIIVMHGVHAYYQKLCRQKAFRIIAAEGLLLASAVILVLALADIVLPSVFPFGITRR